MRPVKYTTSDRNVADQFPDSGFTREAFIHIDKLCTLYVDVDDTLVHWLGTFKDSGREDWEWSAPVVQYMLAWKGPRIVIWSSGGGRYAEHWRGLLEHHFQFMNHVIASRSKFGHVAFAPGDRILDDAPHKTWLALGIVIPLDTL